MMSQRRTIVDGTMTYQCCIPLKLLLPQFNDIPDDVLFLSMGSQLVANFRLVNYTEAFTQCGATAGAYSISNASLVKVYSEVPQEYAAKLLSSNISLPVYNIISVPRPVTLS